MTNGTDKNAKNWEEIYRDKKAGSFLIYPNENLVTLFFQNRGIINQTGKCLDFGFGSGNNSEFLIQHMQELYGIEISKSSIASTRDRLKHFTQFNPAKFNTIGPENEFPNDFFDLVVAWQVLYYNDKQTIKATIAKLFNYLKPGGILICSLTTQRDVKVRHAKAIDENTFIVDKRIPHQEGCQIFSPRNEQELLLLFAAFEIVEYGYFERKSFVAENTLSEYYLIARKR
jgi:SAM-dependent methyltransferase